MRVLVIEDNLQDQFILQNHFDELDGFYDLEMNSNLLSGLKSYQDRKPDLVLLDLSLPDCEGLEGLKGILNFDSNSNVIVFSGNRDLEIAKKAIQIGARDYLLKGQLDSDRLRRAIHFNQERLQKEKLQKRRQRELEQFSKIAAHDLKSPLHNISQILEILKIQDQDDETDYLVLLGECIQKMDQKIDSLLSVLKFKSGVYGKSIERNDLLKIINDVIKSHKALIERQGVDVVLDIEEGLEVNYSEIHLSSVVQNLFSNAIKYGNNENPRIILKGWRLNRSVYFSCEDNGIGIDLNQNKNHLFKLFKRFHDNEQIEGTGIGLNTVQTIVEEYGGKIDVESELGRGTKFTVKFDEDGKVNSNNR